MSSELPVQEYTEAQKRELQNLLSRGFQAISKGDLKTAAESAQAALDVDRELPQAHFLVGLIGLASNDRATAFKAFQSVVSIDKDHAAAWAHLAKLFMTEGQVNRADAALKEARRIKSSDPNVLDLMGTTLSLMGEYDVARAFFTKAVELQPKHLPFMMNLANNLVYHGDKEASGKLFIDALRQQPDNAQAHWALATSRKATDDSQLEVMRGFEKRYEGNPRAEAFVYYAMGKICEDLERWDEAIDAFQKGADARRKTVEYNEQAEIEMFDFLKEVFTEDWVNEGEQGVDDNSPIFVLGQPRTGTTLIERIITSHSSVHSAGELQQFGLALRRLSGYSNPVRFSAELFNRASMLNYEQVGGMYLQTTSRMRGTTPRFVDKLPQNYLMIPMILKALPNAKIVHLVRNPMDACFASFKQLFADAYLHSYHQEEMARHHARYRDLMQTWRERFPGRFFDISYEDTARDLEPNARALIDFLELPWEDACLEFHKQKTAVSTASASQVREPVHTRSIDRWRRYEEKLQPMREMLKKSGVTLE